MTEEKERPAWGLIQPSFSFGEMDPKLFGRIDFEAYYKGLRSCRNMIPSRYGGIDNRPGTEVILPPKSPLVSCECGVNPINLVSLGTPGSNFPISGYRLLGYTPAYMAGLYNGTIKFLVLSGQGSSWVWLANCPISLIDASAESSYLMSGSISELSFSWPSGAAVATLSFVNIPGTTIYRSAVLNANGTGFVLVDVDFSTGISTISSTILFSPVSGVDLSGLSALAYPYGVNAFVINGNVYFSFSIVVSGSPSKSIVYIWNVSGTLSQMISSSYLFESFADSIGNFGFFYAYNGSNIDGSIARFDVGSMNVVNSGSFDVPYSWGILRSGKKIGNYIYCNFSSQTVVFDQNLNIIIQSSNVMTGRICGYDLDLGYIFTSTGYWSLTDFSLVCQIYPELSEMYIDTINKFIYGTYNRRSWDADGWDIYKLCYCPKKITPLIVLTANGTTLNWTFPSSPYNNTTAIWRMSPADGETELSGYDEVNGTEYVDQYVTPGNKYFYAVQAQCDFSNTVAITY